jgi:hypothetical protein
MHASFEILKNKHKLPFDEVVSSKGERYTSVCRVMQVIGDWDLTEAQETKELLPGVEVPEKFDHPKMARYVFGYVVQDLTIAYRDRTDVDLNVILQRAIERAKKWITENPWVFATGEDENKPPKLDANGNIAPRKGDKKVLARQVYDEHKEAGKDWTRKEWIKLLCEKVGLTEAGASTYFHNLKKGIY